jgi:putative transposase
MKAMRFRYCIGVMCLILKVSKSGYYKWLNRKPSRRAREEGSLEVEIKAAHQRTRETCGPERLQHDLKEQGVKVGICRIRRIRKKLGIRCKQKRKFKATTDSKHTLPAAENLLNQRFEATTPNEIWLSDITYISTEEGWLYLAGHKDIFTGEIVGYAMGNRITKNLVSQSLFRAVAAKRPGSGLIHHSDRGSQYCAHEYRRLMDQFKMRASMSRKGDAMIMLPWRASGVRSRTSLSITVASRRENRLSRRSRNTSRYSTIGKDGKHGWGTYPRLSMNGSSMQGKL